jgi:hypothetical protein
MTNDETQKEGLSEELQNLGKNLVEILRAAWEHPERKRLQEEVIVGLNELGTTLKREADNFANSSAGQQIKTNVEGIGERIRSTEAQAKVQSELITALQTANNELQKVVIKLSQAGKPPSEPASPPPAPESHEEPS